MENYSQVQFAPTIGDRLLSILNWIITSEYVSKALAETPSKP